MRHWLEVICWRSQCFLSHRALVWRGASFEPGLGVLLLSLTIVTSAAAQSVQADEPEANPGRPTVSTPATLTPVGYLQFEQGFLGASDSPEFSSRYGLNEVMKLS